MNFWKLYERLNEDQATVQSVDLDAYKNLTLTDLYNNGSDPFIYGISRITKQPKLEVRKNLMTWDGPTNPTHYDMLTSRAVDKDGYTIGQHFMPPGKTIQRGDRPFDVGLIGRIGPDPINPNNGVAIGFYNSDQSQYDQLLKPCLTEMRDKNNNMVSDHTVMICPIHPPSFVGNILRGTQQQTTEMDPETKKMWQQLHLAGPNKAALMKKLGLWQTGGSTLSKYTAAARQFAQPGTDLYAGRIGDHKENPGKTLRE